MSSRIKTLVRLSVALIALALLFYYADPQAVLATLSQAKPGLLLATAVLIATSTLIAAFNTYLLITRDTRVRWSAFLAIFWLSWTSSLLFPGQVGDMATMSVLLRKHDLDWRHVIARTLIDKIISLLLIGTVGAAGIAVLAGYMEPLFALGAGIVTAGLALLCLLLIAARVSTGNDSEHRGWRAQLRRILVEVHQTLQQVPGRIALNFLLSCVKAMLIGLAYWSCLRAMGATSLDEISAILLSAASSVVAYLPISLNGIGVVEAAGVGLFGAVGIAAPVVLSAYIALRACVFALAGIPSLFICLRLR